MTLSYREVIQRIEAVRDVPAKVESLARLQTAAIKLGLRCPANGAGIVLVAGTNGKGSVAKTMETCLMRSGYKVGLFTSPHLMKTTERIRSHGRDLTENEFVAAYNLVRGPVDECKLSHFETLTLMMMEVFFGGRIREPVERAVIEVGVGGRLDPTNVIPHEMAVVTRLGLDHQAVLGESLWQIATHKFAIAEKSRVLVHAPVPSELWSWWPEWRHEFIESRGGDVVVHEAGAFPCHIDAGGMRHGVDSLELSSFRGGTALLEPRWRIDTPWGSSYLALKGQRAVENTSIALQALSLWGEDVSSLLPALTEVTWPCRMEGFWLGGRRVYFSGDHNPQGIESLFEILAAFSFHRLHLVLGVAKNKDLDSIFHLLRGFPSCLSSLTPSGPTLAELELYLTETPFRSTGVDDYRAWIDAHGSSATGRWASRARIFSDAGQALQSALEAADARDLVVVSGSLYLAGSLRRRLFAGEFGSFFVATGTRPPPPHCAQ